MQEILLISADELKKNHRIVRWFGDVEVLAIFSEGEIKVYSGMCPHQGGPLGEGELTNYSLTCPWHGCTFELSTGNFLGTGSCKNSADLKLRGIRHIVKEGMIYVQL